MNDAQTWTVIGIFAAYSGGVVDEILSLFTNVFFIIPTIPLLIDITAFLHTRGLLVMTLVIACTLWAFEARILRGQALQLRNRDFVLAARALGLLGFFTDVADERSEAAAKSRSPVIRHGRFS